MKVQVALDFCLSPASPDCSTLVWFDGDARRGRRFSRAAFLALDTDARRTMWETALETVLVCHESENTALPVVGPVYCAGGCGQLMYAAGTLTPREACTQRSLRSPAFGWDEVRNRPMLELSIAVHCTAPACVEKVLRMFRDSARAIRARNPGIHHVRNCVVCNVADTPNAPFKRCARCHVPCYCSEECHRRDWPTHRTACLAPAPAQ